MQMNISMKQKQTTDWLPRGRAVREGITPNTGLINDSHILCSTGNYYIQYPVISHNGKESENKYMCVCVTESLCCTAEINTTL